MREDAVREYVRRAGADWNVITNLIQGGCLREVKYQGKTFYLRRFSKKA
jgi:hypothetical protein